jgi:hypothetical protein
MSKRSKRFLTFLLCAAIVSNFGCTTTTHRIEPSQAAMGGFGIGKGSNELVGAEIVALEDTDDDSMFDKRTVFENPRRVGPSQAAMGDFGTGRGENVSVRYVKIGNPRIDPNQRPKQRPKLCAVFYKIAATLVQANNIAHFW